MWTLIMVIDDITVIKDYHGPYDKTAATVHNSSEY